MPKKDKECHASDCQVADLLKPCRIDCREASEACQDQVSRTMKYSFITGLIFGLWLSSLSWNFLSGPV